MYELLEGDDRFSYLYLSPFPGQRVVFLDWVEMIRKE